jgi:hypothetical protein
MQLHRLALGLCALGLLTSPSASAAVLNVTDEEINGISQSSFDAGFGEVIGGFINEALFRRPNDIDDSGSGSGIFRDLYKVSDTTVSAGDPQEGYNRAEDENGDAILDQDVPNGFDPVITVGDLVEDSTGTAYVFVVDSNEAGNDPGRMISLDDFRIYTGGTEDPPVLPKSTTDLENAFGPSVYTMSTGGEQNHVLINSSLRSGSGEMDLFVFVPKYLFAGAADTDLVYIYSSFGLYGIDDPNLVGFEPSAGSEQVSIPGKAVSGAVDTFVGAIPEPATGLLLALAGSLLGRRRR